MSYKDQRIGSPQLLGVANCPHCSISAPLLDMKWNSDKALPRGDGKPSSKWTVYACTTCGSLVSAKGAAGDKSGNPPIVQIFPETWEVSEIVPEQARNYLEQSHSTLGSPDASVVMSAASIDAMLKDHDLENGSLYDRIGEAVDAGVLTQKMADWAHRVRLDANNPRHADKSNPHMTTEDATRAFDFADALAEYLYLLPSRMPPKDENSEVPK